MENRNLNPQMFYDYTPDYRDSKHRGKTAIAVPITGGFAKVNG